MKTPAGRVGRPEDVAGLVSWLCGPDASFVTGSYLLIDGGLRDARSAGSFLTDPSDPRAQEVLKLAADEDEQRQRMQPLLDERQQR